MIYETPLTVEELVRLTKLREMLSSGEAQRIRTKAGVSRGEAARACQVQENTVMRWETGRKRPLTRRALGYLRLVEMLSEAMQEKHATSGVGFPD